MTDDDEKINIFVNKKWRNLGIAQKLVWVWVGRQLTRFTPNWFRRHDTWSVAHTDEASKLMQNAFRMHTLGTKKKKKLTLVHDLSGLGL